MNPASAPHVPPSSIQAQIDAELARINQAVPPLPLTPDYGEPVPPTPAVQADIESIFAEPVTASFVPAPNDATTDMFAPAPAPVATVPVQPSIDTAQLLAEIRAMREDAAQRVTPAATAPRHAMMEPPKFDAASLGLPPEIQDRFAAAISAVVDPIVAHNNSLSQALADQDAANKKAISEQGRRVFESNLARSHPDYVKFHSSAAFKAYLEAPVSIYTPEITLRAAYTKSWNDGNLTRVSQILEDYKKLNGAAAPVENTFRAPVTQVSTASSYPAVATTPVNRLVSVSAYAKLEDGYARKRVDAATMQAATAAFQQAARDNRLTT